jgi:hypothetical protein
MSVERERLIPPAIAHELEADTIDQAELATVFGQKCGQTALMQALICPDNRHRR